jgi:hypothetical protein
MFSAVFLGAEPGRTHPSFVVPPVRFAPSLLRKFDVDVFSVGDSVGSDTNRHFLDAEWSFGFLRGILLPL